MKISLILPGLFPEAMAAAIRSIMAASQGIDYELVVVSPFQISGPRIRWVKEEEPRGNCYAHKIGYEASTGDVVAAMSDDVRLVAGWADKALGFLQEREKLNPLLSIGLHRMDFAIGTVFGIYYPYFPMARRETLEAAGGYFSDAYRAHFGDPDLGLRVWSAGGRCEILPDRVIQLVERDPNAQSVGKPQKHTALDRDMATFLGRWQGRYGQGWDTSHLRGFNLDVRGLMQLCLIRDHTVHFNDPRLVELWQNFQRNHVLFHDDMLDN